MLPNYFSMSTVKRKTQIQDIEEFQSKWDSTAYSTPFAIYMYIITKKQFCCPSNKLLSQSWFKN